MAKKKTISIVRGLNPRLTQAEFAGSFQRFDPIFISGESSDEIKSYCHKVGLEQRDLPVKPLWGIDPVRMVLGRGTQHSWVGPDRLLQACRGSDVLETYELYTFFSAQVADVARKLGIPFVCEVWTSFSGHLGYRIPPYALMAKKVLRQASLLVARSNRAAEALTQLGVSEDKLRVIYHGVNLERFHPSNKKRGDGEIRILFVGSLEPSKGVSLLLDIWPKIFGNFPQARLWLVGKGSLLSWARKIEGVKAFGYVHHTKLPEIYRSADIFASPSQNRYLGPFLWWEEFFSYTLMEAQASGLPIVATRCGGIPEEVGEENFLVNQGSVEDLTEALGELIRDKNLRKILAKKNRLRAEKLFNIKIQIQKTEEVILKLI